MKFLVVVFVFAFVAVQLSCSTPIPDEDKKEESVVAPARAADPAPPAAEVQNAPRDQAVALPDPALPAEEKKA